MGRAGKRNFSKPGRSQNRGRGGARPGRGGTAPRRSGFQTARVEEVEDDSDTKESARSVSEAEDISSETEIESASEDDVPDTTQSYATLLQTLNAGRHTNEPPRKKRKVEIPSQNEQELRESTQQQEVKQNGEVAADAALTEQIEDDVYVDAVENEATDSEDEASVLRDPFDQHFVNVQEQKLKDAIATITEKRIRNLVMGEQTRKQLVGRGNLDISGRSIRSIKDLSLKKRLQSTGSAVLRSLSTEEKDLVGEITGYRDVQYGHRTTENASRLRDVACLHALNHVFKTRDRVLKGNAKLSQHEGEEALDFRDQGFARPKVLFIVPTKQACVRYVESITKISEPDQQENKSRFWDTFSQQDDESWENKPPDFQELFGGNHEEDFRVGLKFTRKTIKYFSGFYNSDIIFGSALGLMRTVTTGGGAKDKKKEHDADFLSSIEVVIVDHATAIQMQNFQHLEYVFSQLSQLPKDSHGCDFARVRNWYLDGHAKYLRQTILFSSHHTPELNSLVSNHTHNLSGLAKYTPTYAGAMLNLPPAVTSTFISLPQTFLRFDSPTPQTDADSRFKFFTTAILPSFLRSGSRGGSGSGGTLIFTPTYLDFVRLRNHFSTAHETTSLSFGSVSEYTSVRDTMRARSHFVSGRHSVLIYGERAHHHFRYRIKGVKRLVFYGVPDNPVFWAEVVGFLGGAQEKGNGTARGGMNGVVRALFSRWDVLKLERIVGTERVGRLIGDRGGDVFEFV